MALASSTDREASLQTVRVRRAYNRLLRAQMAAHRALSADELAGLYELSSDEFAMSPAEGDHQ
jgi:hypothetical protein